MNISGQRIRLTVFRIAAFIMVLSVFGISGCGSPSGVENGLISGTVYGNSSGGSVSKAPLAGVSIVAVREGQEPEVIRNTITDSNGEFILSDLPTGPYVIGYSIDGFRTITTEEGNTADRSAVGDQVRVYVEPGVTSFAPDQSLVKLAEDGDGTLVITVLDNVTGEPVTHANVVAGSAVGSNGGSNGVYTLSVPVITAQDAPAGTQPALTHYNIIADGYSYTNYNSGDVQLVANETIYLTVAISPSFSFVSGTIEISTFESLYNLDEILITSDTIPKNLLNQGMTIEANGYFTLRVPCSNTFNTRQINFRFSHPLMRDTVVSNVIAPDVNGTRHMTSPVVLNPITVDVVGSVADSFGNGPNQSNPSGLPDMVTIQQTGQMANIVNGSYTIVDVPICGSASTPASLTINATGYNPLATNPSGGVGLIESKSLDIVPLSDGTSNPVFQAPLIALGSS